MTSAPPPAPPPAAPSPPPSPPNQPPGPPDEPPAAQPPPPPPPPAPPQWSSRRPLRRSRSDKVIGGVAAGLAEYSGIDALLWRVGFVALTLTGGFGILAYVLLWLLMPAAPPGPYDPAAPAAERRRPRRSAGPRSPIPGLTLAGMLIVVGLLVLLSRLTGWDVGPRGFLGSALLIVGLGLVAAAFSAGRTGRSGLIVLGLILSFALIGSTSVDWRNVHGDVGDHTYVAATPSEVQPVYSGSFGDMRIDLSNLNDDLSDLSQPITTRVDGGVGDITILVPQDADVQVTTHTGLGDVRLFDQNNRMNGLFEGQGSQSWVGDGHPEIELIIDAAIGDVEVSRA